VTELCQDFVDVVTVDAVDAGDRYYCYVKIAREDQRLVLTREVGGFVFGERVCMVVPNTWNAP
jgi:hypothetical protein